MRKLKRVQQLDKYGCTIACLAMIIDKPYFATRETIQSKIERLSKQPPVQPEFIGLYYTEFRDVLRYTFNIQCRFIKLSSLRQVKKHCVLWIVPLEWDGRIVHAMMFDAQKRCILDPMGLIKNLEEYNIASCLEID